MLRSLLRRSARVGFYSTDFVSFDDLCIQADENLFYKVLHNPDHVLHRLLPPVAHTSHNYNLRPRAHDRSLPDRLTHLTTDCNFIIRMLFYQVYWLYLMHACFTVLHLRSGSCQIHGYVMLCYYTHKLSRRVHGLVKSPCYKLPWDSCSRQ